MKKTIVDGSFSAHGGGRNLGRGEMFFILSHTRNK